MIATQVYNRQRRVKLDLHWLRAFTEMTLPECLKHSNGDSPVLPTLPEVEISIVSDKAIAKVHAQFMDDPTPTDVITFDHGEILVSADTAGFNAERFGKSLHSELGLYIIHGLLHLNGFRDKKTEEAAQMHRVQDQLLELSLGLCKKSIGRIP